MNETCFLSQITLNTVGQLQNCAIVLSKKERQHLILTGRNGSGKTAILQAIRDELRQKSIKPPVTLPCTMNDMPGQWFLQHLVHVHVEKTLTTIAGDHATVTQLESWLIMPGRAFQKLFQDPTLPVQVGQETPTVTFSIHHEFAGYRRDLRSGPASTHQRYAEVPL